MQIFNVLTETTENSSRTGHSIHEKNPSTLITKEEHVKYYMHYSYVRFSTKSTIPWQHPIRKSTIVPTCLTLHEVKYSKNCNNNKSETYTCLNEKVRCIQGTANKLIADMHYTFFFTRTRTDYAIVSIENLLIEWLFRYVLSRQ